MVTSATGDAVAASSVRKVFGAAGTATPVAAQTAPASGAATSGLRSTASATPPIRRPAPPPGARSTSTSNTDSANSAHTVISDAITAAAVPVGPSSAPASGMPR